MKNIIMKIVGILIFLFSFYVMYLLSFTNLAVILGVVIMAVGLTMYIMSSPSTYNDSVSSVREIENKRGLTVEDFYRAFKENDSIMGKPWLGKVKTIRNKCLIFGPSEGGDFLYFRKQFGRFYISSSYSTYWINGPEEELWRLEETQNNWDIFSDEELVCYSLISETALYDIYEVLNLFAETGRVTAFPVEMNKGKIYRFTEEFKLMGQRFYLTDFEGEPLYRMEGTAPLKTFTMTDIKTNEEIFKMTKRILHLLDHYEFYLKGEKLGMFEQKFDVFHDTFRLEIPEGTIQMQSLNDHVGTNYIVKLNDKIIATIAEKFNLTAHNIVFDNFILHVRDEKYMPLVAALTVMVARELKRDKLDADI